MKTLKDFNIDIICANGQTIPYLGYIEVLIGLSDCHGIELYAPILIVPATEYNENVPAIIGTNLIREFANLCSRNSSEVSPEWKSAFISLQCSKVGTVKSTRKIKLHPMEVKTVTGIVRKTSEVESAVTEPIDEFCLGGIAVCPRVVSMKNPGGTSRVPVRLCNITAKTVFIHAKASICELNKVSVLRSVSMFNDESEASTSPTVSSSRSSATTSSVSNVDRS
jgi:hypothetical protein